MFHSSIYKTIKHNRYNTSQSFKAIHRCQNKNRMML